MTGTIPDELLWLERGLVLLDERAFPLFDERAFVPERDVERELEVLFRVVCRAPPCEPLRDDVLRRFAAVLRLACAITLLLR